MNLRTISILLSVFFWGLPSMALPARADEGVSPVEENYSVPNVVTAFDNLTEQGEWIGFHTDPGAGPVASPPVAAEHIQGIARSPRSGYGDDEGPVFYLTTSGGLESDTLYPALIVVQMPSRPKLGERLRSNRLEKGVETTFTAPDTQDVVVNSIRYYESDHPSGIQMVGDILAVPVGKGKAQPKVCVIDANDGTVEGDKNKDYGLCQCTDTGTDPRWNLCGDCGENNDDVFDDGKFHYIKTFEQCAGTGLFDYYGAKSKGRLISPEILLPALTSPDDEILLTYWQFVSYYVDDEDNSKDRAGCEIQISTQNKDTGLWGKWERIDFAVTQHEIPEWEETAPIPLTKYAGENVKIAFYHKAVDEADTDFDQSSGWFVDHITISLDSTNTETFYYHNFNDDEDTWYPEPDSPWEIGALKYGGRIVFYDCSDPTHPERLPYSLNLSHGSQSVGITKLKDDGTFFLVINSGKEAFFYRSEKTSFWDQNGEPETDMGFVKHGVLCKNYLKSVGGGDYWPSREDHDKNFQSISLVSQSDGSVFLIGSTNSSLGSPTFPIHGIDEMYLLQVHGFKADKLVYMEGFHKEIPKTLLTPGSTHTLNILDPITLLPNYYYLFQDPSAGNLIKTLDWRWQANFNAGASAYVSPSGELIYYGAFHWTDGPETSSTNADKPGTTGKIVELRHNEVYQTNSTAYRTTAHTGGPYWVTEGNTVQLDGTLSRPSIAEPWIHLFDDIHCKGQSVMVDHVDRNSDDYNDFSKLDGEPLLNICVDQTKLTNLGNSLLNLISTIQGLTASDFVKEKCLGTGEAKVCADVPNFGADSAWAVFPDLVDLTVDLIAMAASIRVCGLALDYLPPIPDELKALDLNKYGTIPTTLDAFIEYIADLTSLVTNLTKAITKAPTYINELIAYRNYLESSLKGFNNRASSLRYYAPVGVDLLLYEKPNYQGGFLRLEGTGSVAKIAQLSEYELDNEKSAHDRIRSLGFDGTFSNPTLSSFLWSLDDDPTNPLFIDIPTSGTPSLDATSGDGPATVNLSLTVLDTSGNDDTAMTSVQVLNVAPSAEIDRMEDQTGTAITGTVPMLLEAVEYKQFGHFTDPGTLDTHTAMIDWGDGSTPNTSGDGVLQLSDSLGGVMGTVEAPHTFAQKGIFTTTLEVTDKDGDTDQASLQVRVVDASDATQSCVDMLLSLLEEPELDKTAEKAIAKALSLLRGNDGGVATNGVLDKLEVGELSAALSKVVLAMAQLAKALKADPDLASLAEPNIGSVQLLMTHSASSVAMKAIWEAEGLASSVNDTNKISEAYNLLNAGNEKQANGDYKGAAENYEHALIAVQGIL